MESILKVDNLSKVFLRGGQQPVTAVKNVSFELMPGECLGVLGESGSGKTTMVSMITRLLDVTVGQIILDGQNITNLRGKELRSVYRCRWFFRLRQIPLIRERHWGMESGKA